MFFRNSMLALTLGVAGTCFAGSVAHSAGSVGEQCSAFIETDRPGVDVTVPYGAVHRSLAKARREAFDRCSLTEVAEEGWGQLCRTWCIPADR